MTSFGRGKVLFFEVFVLLSLTCQYAYAGQHGYDSAYFFTGGGNFYVGLDYSPAVGYVKDFSLGTAGGETKGVFPYLGDGNQDMFRSSDFDLSFPYSMIKFENSLLAAITGSYGFGLGSLRVEAEIGHERFNTKVLELGQENQVVAFLLAKKLASSVTFGRMDELKAEILQMPKKDMHTFSKVLSSVSVDVDEKICKRIYPASLNVAGACSCQAGSGATVVDPRNSRISQCKTNVHARLRMRVAHRGGYLGDVLPMHVSVTRDFSVVKSAWQKVESALKKLEPFGAKLKDYSEFSGAVAKYASQNPGTYLSLFESGITYGILPHIEEFFDAHAGEHGALSDVFGVDVATSQDPIDEKTVSAIVADIFALNLRDRATVARVFATALEGAEVIAMKALTSTAVTVNACYDIDVDELDGIVPYACFGLGSSFIGLVDGHIAPRLTYKIKAGLSGAISPAITAFFGCFYHKILGSSNYDELPVQRLVDDQSTPGRTKETVRATFGLSYIGGELGMRYSF